MIAFYLKTLFLQKYFNEWSQDEMVNKADCMISSWRMDGLIPEGKCNFGSIDGGENPYKPSKIPELG